MNLEDMQSENLDEIRDELETIQDHLSSAESCETVSDYFANLRELLQSAKTLVSRVNDAINVAKEDSES